MNLELSSKQNQSNETRLKEKFHHTMKGYFDRILTLYLIFQQQMSSLNGEIFTTIFRDITLRLKIQKESVYIHNFKYISNFKVNKPCTFEKNCQINHDIFDIANTSDILQHYQNHYDIEYKLFPGILYKDLTDFQPKKIIKLMKKWFDFLYNAQLSLVSLDLEKNGWNCKGFGAK